MKTIFVKITDGKYVTAVSTKAKAIALIRERYSCDTKEAKRRLEEGEWQEITLD
jgi:hypothetical protein